LQVAARQSSRKCPGSAPAFLAAYNHPELNAVAAVRNEAPAEQLAAEATSFALSHEADAIGIAPMDPLYVFEGYTIDEPWVIVLALAHNYERLKQVPSDETNGVGVTDIGDQYARGTRASYALANWIRSQGYNAGAYPGPSADALLLIPPAIASGLGELGKHGSLISRQFGAGIRLAGVYNRPNSIVTIRKSFVLSAGQGVSIGMLAVGSRKARSAAGSSLSYRGSRNISRQGMKAGRANS
jgi:hypothetical protein